MQAARQWVLIIVLAVTLIGYGPVPPALATAAGPADKALLAKPAAQNSALSLTEPSACPPGGCAAGQRLGMRFEFSLSVSGYDASLNPNIKVCIYAPSKWSAAATDISKGEITAIEYNASDPASNCAQDTSQPADYTLMIERQAQLKQNTTGDSLRFGFRLGKAAAGSGTVIARLFAQTAQDKWALIASASSSIIDMASTPISTTVYVANNGASCGSYSPCYINSYGDLPNGVGTGLKDAIDVVDEKSTIYILGDYSVKSEIVQVNQKLSITGVNNSRITYNGSSGSCGAAMLALDETVKLSGLNIDDGNCTGTHRNLIEINSKSGRTGADDNVSILYNDLSNGDNAIYVKSTTTDPVIIRYNEIISNTGYAVYYENNANATSSLDVTANNLQSNRSGSAIQCAQNGIATNQKANHNYWGVGSPTSTDSYCIIDPAKRLGAPILHNGNTPGVAAERETVKTGKYYPPTFNNQIAFNRSGSGGSDFDIYVVNHGYMNTSAPFTYDLGGEGVSPCSNYWDVFLADEATVSNPLELYFKYNDHNGGAPGCITTINSSLYCDQTSSTGKYPLYWFDPSSSPATRWWDPVGAKPEKLSSGEGQATTCHMDQNEIQVSIDGSGRPNTANDLNYSPFVVGIPVIKEFLPRASSQTVNVTWTTNVEPDISGFYVLWGNSRDNLSLLNDTMIAHTGTSTSGKSYSLYHYNRVNGSTYYYRLKVVRSDGTVFYSEIYEIKVDVATPVPPTPTYTWTPVVPTRTRTATTVYQNYPTQSGIKTATPQKTATASKTVMLLPTLTRTLDARTPGVLDTLEVLTLTPEPQNPLFPGASTPGGGQIGAPGTEVAQVGIESPTPSPSPTTPQAVAGENAVNTHPWLSLLLGLLAGTMVVGGAGGWWYRSKSSK